jgi:hypothetical protein
VNPSTSRDGALKMGFGEKMKVPSFIKTDKKTGRLLTAGKIPIN